MSSPDMAALTSENHTSQTGRGLAPRSLQSGRPERPRLRPQRRPDRFLTRIGRGRLRISFNQMSPATVVPNARATRIMLCIVRSPTPGGVVLGRHIFNGRGHRFVPGWMARSEPRARAMSKPSRPASGPHRGLEVRVERRADPLVRWHPRSGRRAPPRKRTRSRRGPRRWPWGRRSTWA